MPRRPSNLLLAAILAVALFVGAFSFISSSNAARDRARSNAAQIAQIKDLQTQELATFNLLKATVEKFSGPAAQKAQRAATLAFINDLVARIQAEDNALLAAINNHSPTVVTRTRTVCHLPNGRSC